MKKIKINIPQKEYNVFLGSGVVNQIPQILKKEKLSGKILLVFDSKVKYHYGKQIKDTFKDSELTFNSMSIVSSEKNKSFETLQKIHKVLIDNNFGRDSIIVAIGGGIIGDIVGLAASTFMRGIKYVQIPTTLLASVDSSVGGKTGINFNHTKNVIGSFYQPETVIIDTNFFNTLPAEEILCGLGEIIKYCFLIDKSFYGKVSKNIDQILNNDEKIIKQVIESSIRFKGSVVENDEKEAGIRKVLNLGHTFAHGFEVEQNHKIKHGQAVIVGITCAAYLSYNLGIITINQLNEYIILLKSFSQKIKLRYVDKAKLHKIMHRDKKNRNDEIKFVLIKNIGEIVTDIIAPKKIVSKSINEALAHFQK